MPTSVFHKRLKRSRLLCLTSMYVTMRGRVTRQVICVSSLSSKKQNSANLSDFRQGFPGGGGGQDRRDAKMTRCTSHPSSLLAKKKKVEQHILDFLDAERSASGTPTPSPSGRSIASRMGSDDLGGQPRDLYAATVLWSAVCQLRCFVVTAGAGMGRSAK